MDTLRRLNRNTHQRGKEINKNIIIAILAAALVIVGGLALHSVNQQKAETARIIQLMEEEKAAREKKEAEIKAIREVEHKRMKEEADYAVNYKW